MASPHLNDLRRQFVIRFGAQPSEICFLEFVLETYVFHGIENGLYQISGRNLFSRIDLFFYTQACVRALGWNARKASDFQHELDVKCFERFFETYRYIPKEVKQVLDDCHK